MFGGWNGPYWNGSVDGSNRPLDGWGRPLQLRWVSSGWQVVSYGANGNYDSSGFTSPQGDDLAYPVVPATPMSFSAVLNVVLSKDITTSGSVSVQDRSSGALRNINLTSGTTSSTSVSLDTSTSLQTFTGNPVAGGVLVTINRSTPSPSPLTFVMDLLPGEVRTVQVDISP